MKFRKNIYNSIKIIKYPGINLMKDKLVYPKLQKSAEIKEDLNK